MFVDIKDTPPLPPIGLIMHLCTRTPSDVSNINPITVKQQPPIVHFKNLPPIPFYARATTINHLDAQQENCSGLALHPREAPQV